MHRRITTVIEYKPPTAAMRTAIWRNLLLGPDAAPDTATSTTSAATANATTSTSTSVTAGTTAADTAVAGAGKTVAVGGSRLRLAADVDIAAIASKYELVGISEHMRHRGSWWWGLVYVQCW